MATVAAIDAPYVYLTTVGRRSGRPHEIEIWFCLAEATYHLISGGKDRSDWVRNLLAEPGATVRLGASRSQVRARLPLPDGPERTAAVAALHAKYADQVSGSVQDWEKGAYIVALDIEGAAPT